MKVRFICGCTHDVIREDMGWWRNVSSDSAGFIVCVLHNERREGWRSLPADVRTNFPDYSFAAWTLLEIEKFMVWGDVPRNRDKPLRPNDTPDIRDNRDPEQVGHAYLSRSNGK